MIRTDNNILNAFTVDVEDYFHVQSFADRIDPKTWDDYQSRVVANTRKVLRILAEHQVRGTFFILGWVADRFPGLVREIHEAGHEIGCHGFWHKLIYDMEPEAFRDDLRQARDTIEHITGEPVVAYRAPSFSITNDSLWALDILIEEGFQYDSSIFPVYHDKYGIPNAPRFPYRITAQQPEAVSALPSPGEGSGVRTSNSPLPPAGEGPGVRASTSPLSLTAQAPEARPLPPSLLEFPPTVYRIWKYNLPIAGGGYFRLYPARFSLHCLNRINRRNRQPFVFYIHPWELDPDQPRLPGSWKSQFRHYQNLRRTEGKLGRLLHTFRFGPLSQALAGGTGEAGGFGASQSVDPRPTWCEPQVQDF